MIYKTTRRFLIGLALAASVGIPLAMAQDAAPAKPQAAPVRVRGTIDQLTDDSITVTKNNGTKQVIQLAPKYNVSALVPATLADIKEGVFIGTTARPSKDGGLHATEVHIFPEAMRGAGEGHYPWDTNPDATMTNASVTKLVSAVSGSTLSLTYKGGQQTVTVVPETSIVAVTPGTKDDLKKGAAIFAICAPQPDGSLKTGFLLVGRGVSPPM
ncbi:MAG: hypothetical protein JWM91_545 [Rhodospirillales bacterium]|nr:hypothetical protein [Rhodospirillales bacterium]